MAASKKIIVTMDTPQPKKHSTRYDATDADAAMTTAYIRKSDLEKLGNPSKVKITIEAA